MAELMTISTRDFATPALQRKFDQLRNRRPLMGALGKRLEVELRDHFRGRNAEPNKANFPKQNFWNRIRTATALTSFDNECATVTVADPAFGFKVTGGTIKPKEGKALSIPIHPAAAGIMPRSKLIPGLFHPRGTRVLAIKSPDGKSLINLYMLAPSVTQQADPRALPPREKIVAALHQEAEAWFQRNVRNN
jgi:hypothetical protein